MINTYLAVQRFACPLPSPPLFDIFGVLDLADKSVVFGVISGGSQEY